jgi:hypothetical protein
MPHDDNDDGPPPPPPPGSVPQFELVVRSDPAAHSHVEVPSGFFSGSFTSDALPGDGDTVIGGLHASPPLRYDRRFPPRQPRSVYRRSHGIGIPISQSGSMVQVQGPAPLCNLDSVPPRYRVLPDVTFAFGGTTVYLWTLQAERCSVGYEVFRREIDYDEHTFCNM